MGDIVACTPFATWVRLRHPQILIVWVARLPYHEVLRKNWNIDAVLYPLPYCITGWIWLKKFLMNLTTNLMILPTLLKVLREVSTCSHRGTCPTAGISVQRSLQFRFPSQRHVYGPPGVRLTKETP